MRSDTKLVAAIANIATVLLIGCYDHCPHEDAARCNGSKQERCIGKSSSKWIEEADCAEFSAECSVANPDQYSGLFYDCVYRKFTCTGPGQFCFRDKLVHCTAKDSLARLSEPCENGCEDNQNQAFCLSAPPHGSAGR
jgi:hypothetical protein